MASCSRAGEMAGAGNSRASARSTRACTEPIHAGKEIAAPSVAAPASFIFIGSRSGCERLEDLAFEHAHLLLRRLQVRLAEPGELEPALVRAKRLLERQLAGLHAIDD